LPARKRIAATQLEATKLEVGAHVLGFAAEVRAAFYEAQAAEQVVSMRRLVHDAAQAAAELARRQHEAGTMNDLALSTELGLAAQTAVDLTRALGAAAVAREHLTRLMGVWGTATGWRIGPKLPELPSEEVALERLETRAIEQRLDVGAARRELQALDASLSLARTTRWTGLVTINLEAGRLRDTKRVSVGYGATLEVPLFDQKQAGIARLESAKRTLENNLQGLSIDVRSEVRASAARVTTARRLVEQYGSVLVPLRESIVKYSQEQYDAMLLGVYQLLQAKQSELAAYAEYIEALRDYWIARSDLERAVGSRLEAVSHGPRPKEKG
jgi:cobalt-zinc-cadmium efflux system outer membrane protein